MAHYFSSSFLQFKKMAHEMTDMLCGYLKGVSDVPVRPEVKVRKILPMQSLKDLYMMKTAGSGSGRRHGK